MYGVSFVCSAQKGDTNPGKYLVKEGIIKYMLQIYPLPYHGKEGSCITRYVSVQFSDSGAIKTFTGDYFQDSGILKITKHDSVYTYFMENGTEYKSTDRYKILPEVFSLESIVPLPPVFEDKMSKKRLKSKEKIICKRYYASSIWHKDVTGQWERRRGSSISIYKNIPFIADADYADKNYVYLRAIEYTETH